MKEKLKIVDIATGTADQLLAIFRKRGKNHIAVGLDMSAEMLTIGRNKVIKHGLTKQITLVHGDALKIPLLRNSADAVTITFGIRNLVDIDQGLTRNESYSQTRWRGYHS